MKQVVDVPDLPFGVVSRLRSFYSTLRENQHEKKLHALEEKMVTLRNRTELALDCFLSFATTLSPLDRRLMEERLLESMLQGLRDAQNCFMH